MEYPWNWMLNEERERVRILEDQILKRPIPMDAGEEAESLADYRDQQERLWGDAA